MPVSTTAIIVVLGFTTSVLAVGWALTAWRVSRVLQTLTDGIQYAASEEVGAPSRARDGSDGVGSNELPDVRCALETIHSHALDAEKARRALEVDLLHRDKRAAVGQMCTVLSRQLGSALLVVNGRARAIAAASDLPLDVVRYARIIEEQAERITETVERLLPLCRRHSVPAIIVDLPHVLAGLLEMMEPAARHHGIRLQLVCRHVIPPLMADVDELRLLVANLVINGCRATAIGGRVRVVLSRGWAPLPDKVRQRTVRIAVEDTGGGIASEQRDRVFEPFFTTWGEHGGLGLGLTIVDTIVREHAGQIDIASKVGRGTTVTVAMPALATRDGARHAPADVLPARPGSASAHLTEIS
jgi:signal transduction histidine kinase